MPISIDTFNQLILITSPTTEVDVQTLHDTVEDFMASPEGMMNDGTWDAAGDILKPEGKIEDPSQPGVFSQIILVLSPQWQIQFWGSSGYTRIFGGKLVGGVADEPIKATGTAGDITVLESPVDGLVVSTGVSGLSPTESLMLQHLWQDRGFDASNVVTFDETAKTISVAGTVRTWAGNLIKTLTRTT